MTWHVFFPLFLDIEKGVQMVVLHKKKELSQSSKHETRQPHLHTGILCPKWWHPMLCVLCDVSGRWRPHEIFNGGGILRPIGQLQTRNSHKVGKKSIKQGATGLLGGNCCWKNSEQNFVQNFSCHFKNPFQDVFLVNLRKIQFPSVNVQNVLWHLILGIVPDTRWKVYWSSKMKDCVLCSILQLGI